MTAPVADRPPRFAGFDGLRAIASVGVLVTHVTFSARTNHVTFGSYFARMDAGVSIFFVISGFLLYRPFARSAIEDQPRPRLSDYLKRRGLRIFPAYLVAIAFVGFVLDINRPLTLARTVMYALLLQLYVPGLYRGTTHGPLFESPIPQSWTLATEISFYAFLPVLGWLITRRPAPTRARRVQRQIILLACLYAVSVGFRVFVFKVDPAPSLPLETWLPARFDDFSLGMALAVASVCWPVDRQPALVRTRFFAGGSWLVALGFFTLVSYGVGLPTSDINYSSRDLLVRQVLYGLMSFFLVAPAVLGHLDVGAIRRFLASRLMVVIGLGSYAIYLFHEAAIHEYLEFADQNFGATSPLRMLVVVSALSGVAAYLSYRYIELPPLSLKDRPLWPTLRATTPPDLHRRPGFGWKLTLIAVLALAFRVVFVMQVATNDPDGGDPFYYHHQANLIADGDGYAEPFTERSQGEIVPSAIHPPGFSTYLAGASVLGFESYFSHKLMSVLAGVAVIVLLALAVRLLAGDRAALLAAALAAAYPNLWVIEGTLMPEALYGATIALVLLAAVWWLRSPSIRRTAALGAAVATASLVRTESLSLCVLLLLPLVLTRIGRWRDRLVHLALAGTVIITLLLPWVVRNQIAFGEPTLSLNGEEVIRNANCDRTYAGRLLGFWSLDCYTPTPPVSYDEAERAHFWRRAGVSYIDDHLGHVPVVAAARIGRVWDVFRPDQNVELSTLEGRNRRAAQVGQYAYFVVLPFSVLGLWVLRRRGDSLIPLLSMVAMVTLTAVAAYGVIRFRVPAEVALLAGAAVGIDHLVSAWRAPAP